MPDNNSGEDIKQEPSAHNAEAQSVNPQSPPDDTHPTAAQSISRQQVQSEVKGIEGRVRRAERWMIGLTGAIAFFALCSAIVGSLQWMVMQGQLTEMKAATVVAKQSAQAASDAVRLAQDAAKDTERSFRLQQRPYVFVVGIDPSASLKEGVNMLELTMRNAGKTPGLNLVTLSTAFIDGKPVSKANPSEISHGTIGDQPVTAAAPLTLNSVTAQGILSGTVRLEVRGEVRYNDIFTDSHVTQFCGFYNVQRSKFSVCATRNDIR